MIKLDTGKDIYTIIQSNEQLSGMTLSPCVVKPDTPTPYAVYSRTQTDFVETKDFIQKNADSVDITIVADEYTTGVDLAEKFINTLLTYNYSQLGIKNISLLNSSESFDFEYQKFIQNITIQIKY